ncbi:MAG TPA: glucose 1-dehydrogenase [Caldilineaceae bacterium]|nr:glucose 1-dehydrogenase [Caldilineaceae bacterium]
MEKRLAGKVAVVTGAGQGIGKGVALRLAAEGAKVVVAEFNPASGAATAQEIVGAGGEAISYLVNIAEPAASRQMVVDVVASFGRIDLLVNNAGRAQTKPMMDLTESDWDNVVDVNQRGMFFCLQAVAAQMIRQIPAEQRAGLGLADVAGVKSGATAVAPPTQNNGKIVNLSSISGRRGRPLSSHYAASKAAVISITQSAALTLAPYNITVNAVCPGIVATAMWQQIDEERGRLFGSQPGEAMAAFINTVPLKRAATPADVAGVIAFFCSPDADYVTGQALNIDGGFEMN